MLRRSPEWYTRYMALMTNFVENEPSSFEESVEKHVWVDAMMEEYESIVKKSVWEVVPRPKDKSVVGLRWIFKVKHVVDKEYINIRQNLWPSGTLKLRELTVRKNFLL